MVIRDLGFEARDAAFTNQRRVSGRWFPPTSVPRCQLALDIRHALSASAPESLEALREMLGNLEAQLVSLYEEKETTWKQAAPDETLTALYEDKQRLSARTIADLRESVNSLSTQLAEFYEAREHGHDGGDSAALRITLDSLTQQLHTLYEERELGAFAASPSGDIAALQATVRSFEEQLHALYDERTHAPFGHGEAVAMVHNLEAQVAALLEERNDLADQLARSADDVASAKRKARELVNALVEQSFT
jgi:uncharacterized phage infection (PIP) family protein YhgE